MTHEQYCRQLGNRRYRGAGLVFDELTVAAVLHQARRHERRHQQAQRALGLVLPDEQSEAVRIVSLQHGVLEVATSDPLVREQLRRRSGQIRRQLGKYIPGLQRLRVK